MARGLDIYLLDVLESVDKIEEYTAGKEEHDFLDDTLLQDAVLRRLEVMGEAVKGMPGDVREEHPDVPWDEIAVTVSQEENQRHAHEAWVSPRPTSSSLRE